MIVEGFIAGDGEDCENNGKEACEGRKGANPEGEISAET